MKSLHESKTMRELTNEELGLVSGGVTVGGLDLSGLLGGVIGTVTGLVGTVVGLVTGLVGGLINSLGGLLGGL